MLALLRPRHRIAGAGLVSDPHGRRARLHLQPRLRRPGSACSTISARIAAAACAGRNPARPASSSASITAGCSARTAPARHSAGRRLSGRLRRTRPRPRAVPRLEQYRGFWFIYLDANAMSLSDYLAGAKEYIDNIVDQSEIGMTIVPGGQNFQVDANWKLWHENGMDPFHVHSRAPDLFRILRRCHRRSARSGRRRKAFRPRSSTLKASAEDHDERAATTALMQTKTKLRIRSRQRPHGLRLSVDARAAVRAMASELGSEIQARARRSSTTKPLPGSGRRAREEDGDISTITS